MGHRLCVVAHGEQASPAPQALVRPGHTPAASWPGASARAPGGRLPHSDRGVLAAGAEAACRQLDVRRLPRQARDELVMPLRMHAARRLRACLGHREAGRRRGPPAAAPLPRPPRVLPRERPASSAPRTLHCPSARPVRGSHSHTPPAWSPEATRAAGAHVSGHSSRVERQHTRASAARAHPRQGSTAPPAPSWRGPCTCAAASACPHPRAAPWRPRCRWRAGGHLPEGWVWGVNGVELSCTHGASARRTQRRTWAERH